VASPQLGFDEQDHADLVMDMGPRSLRQRRSASPDRDTEGAVRQFISAVSKALPVVIAMAAAQRKQKLPDTTDGLPRRSARVAAQGRRRVNKPEIQAQNVLMKKWQVTSMNSSPDADAVAAYNEVFQSPIRSTQHRAIRVLFTSCPSLGEVDGDLSA
jgi:hypothetical protein